MDNIKFLLAITSIIAAGFPITIYLISKRNNLFKSKTIIELLEQRNKIKELQKKKSDFNDIPLVKDKLGKLLDDINSDLNTNTDEFKIWLFLFFVTIEIFFAFNKLSEFILAKSWESGIYYLEGIFRFPTVRVVGLLLIFIISIIISFQLINWIKERYKDRTNLKLNLYLIILLNLVFLMTCGVISGLLTLMDKYIAWF